MTKFSPTKPLLLVIFLLMFVQPVFSSHYMGGEITWECTPQGNFRFIAKLYRECQGINYAANWTIVSNAPGFPSIPISRVSVTNISPQCGCSNGPFITCPATLQNTGAIEVHEFNTDVAYPDGVPLTGTPPASGWYFGITTCCRNLSNNITSASSLGFFLRTWMFPYNNTSVNNCFDNSPAFMESPSTVFCTNHPQISNTPAYDTDGDSLVYSWAQPLDDDINTPIVTYQPGYSYLSPLPSDTHHLLNESAILNPRTGEITFHSYTIGAYVVAISVASYKSGIKVAEIFREFQLVLRQCMPAQPPSASLAIPSIPGTHHHFSTTVFIGDTVNIPIQISSSNLCQGTTQGTPLYLSATGTQFDSLITGHPCPDTPCALLSPSPGPAQPLISPSPLSTTFSWVVNASHLDYSTGIPLPKRHTFRIDVNDDHCPVPMKRHVFIHIDVATPFTSAASEIHCIQADSSGAITVRWNKSNATPPYFTAYEIMHSPAFQAPFYSAGQIIHPNDTFFVLTGGNPHLQNNRFYINQHINLIHPITISSADTAENIRLEVQTTSATEQKLTLAWTPLTFNGTPTQNTVYEIHRNDGNGWQMLYTTTLLQATDYVQYLNQQVQYRIEAFKPSGGACPYVSNTTSDLLSTIEEIHDNLSSTKIFPNPVKGSVKLSTGELIGSGMIRLTGSNGMIVKEYYTELHPNTIMVLETDPLPAGFYILTIMTAQHCFSTRVVSLGQYFE